MIGFLEGLKVTLKTAGRKPVTAQYPEPQKRLAVQDRYMGFPALLWDGDVPEPYCTGCMVCIRNCPTQCMSAQMMDNPKHAEGTSRRRKIISEFEINLGRCILCGICVDVCNFDAIEMSHEHELSKYERNGNRADLPTLLEMGQEFQVKTGWKPTQPEKNSGVPVQRDAAPTAQAAPTPTMSKEERLAAARARAAAKRPAQDESATEAQAAPMSKEERLAAARARAAAKRQVQDEGAAEAQAAPMSQEERLAAARARAAAKRQVQDEGATEAQAAPMSQEERLAAARARAAAKRQAQEAQESETS